MERSRPNWQNYLVAIVLTAALLAGGFYGKFLFSTMEAGLFIGCCAVGALPSGRRPPLYRKECVRMLPLEKALAISRRQAAVLAGWYLLLAAAAGGIRLSRKEARCAG